MESHLESIGLAIESDSFLKLVLIESIEIGIAAMNVESKSPAYTGMARVIDPRIESPAFVLADISCASSHSK